MVDAEYTYMNPALNLLTLAMMLNYNQETPLVAYTYQNYLKVLTIKYIMPIKIKYSSMKKQNHTIAKNKRTTGKTLVYNNITLEAKD